MPLSNNENKYETFWNDIVQDLRVLMNLHIDSDEEIERELKAFNANPLPDDKINQIVKRIVNNQDEDYSPEPENNWHDDINVEELEGELITMNRNQGKPDAEIAKLLERLRNNALDEGTLNDIQRRIKEKRRRI